MICLFGLMILFDVLFCLMICFYDMFLWYVWWFCLMICLSKSFNTWWYVCLKIINIYSLYKVLGVVMTFSNFPIYCFAFILHFPPLSFSAPSSKSPPSQMLLLLLSHHIYAYNIYALKYIWKHVKEGEIYVSLNRIYLASKMIFSSIHSCKWQFF